MDEQTLSPAAGATAAPDDARTQPIEPQAAPVAESATATTKPEPPDRAGAQWCSYLLLPVAFLVVPFVVAICLPAHRATSTMLVELPLAAVLLGLLDGATFRRTWAFPLATTAVCWLGLVTMFTPGTWIYALAVGALCGVGVWLGGLRHHKG